MSFPLDDQATLQDVAAHAGVSMSTVSRVLTGRTRVSAAATEKVLAAVEKLSYRPNAAAQTLVSGRRSTVAVLARNTSRYGYAATLEGIELAARRAGFTVTISVVEDTLPESVRRSVDRALAQPVAGVIVIEFDSVGSGTLNAIPGSVPTVAAAGAPHRHDARPYAFLDDFQGGVMATRHLLELGHQTVHHVAIPATRPRSGRSWGWRRALSDAGIRPPRVVEADYDPLSGYRAGQVLLDDASVTAVLCGNDELALGVMRAFQERGRRIPEDVSVMGFDDQPFAAMWMPALSTVGQDFTDLGERSFALLAKWLETGVRPEDSAASPVLRIRESTSAPRS